MSDDEKKQAWYIANAQGYCLEFRLSENTVNSYDTYCTERDKYKTGANPGGGWVPLKDWLVSNGFTSKWFAGGATGVGTPPLKNGNRQLWDAIDSKIVELGLAKDNCVIGAHGGADDTTWSGSGGNDTDGDGKCAVYYRASYASRYNDSGWQTFEGILLVRPL